MAVKCNACGTTDVVDGSAFCHRCGANIAVGPAPQSLSAQSAPPPATSTAPPTMAAGTGTPAGQSPSGMVPPSRKQEPERDIWTVQFSPRGMIGSWLIVGVIVAACLIAATMWTTIAWYWFLLLSVLVILAQQCRYWYRRFNERYRLTSYRLLQESGIVSRTVNRVELIDIEDIQLVRTLIDRMVGIGSIIVLSTDVSHPKMRISAIDDVEKRFDELEQVMRVEKRRREFRIEQS